MEEISCIKDGVTGVCRDLKDKTARASVEEVKTKLNEVVDFVNGITGADAGHLATDEDIDKVYDEFYKQEDEISNLTERMDKADTSIKGIEDKITDVAKVKTYTFTNYTDMLSKLQAYVGSEEKVTLIVNRMSCNTSQYLFSGYDITNGEPTWYTVNTPSSSNVTIWGRFKMIYNPNLSQYAFQKISAYMHTNPYTYGNDCETIFFKSTGTYYKRDKNTITDNSDAILKKSTNTTEFHQIYNYTFLVENYTLEIEETN